MIQALGPSWCWLAVGILATLAVHPNFSWRALDTITSTASWIGLFSLGVGAVLMRGSLDLSVPGIAALSGVVVGSANSLSPQFGLPLAAAGGLVCGLLNGWIVAVLRVNPSLVTIGTSCLFSGLAIRIADHARIPLSEDASGMFMWWMTSGSLGVPPGFLILVGVSVALAWVIHKTGIHRPRTLDQGSREPDGFVNLSPVAPTMPLFVLCGLLSALAGFLRMAATGQADPYSGHWELFMSVGVVLLASAGRPLNIWSPVAMLIGSIAMSLMMFGATKGGLNQFAQQLFLGVLIVVSLLIVRLLDPEAGVAGSRRGSMAAGALSKALGMGAAFCVFAGTQSGSKMLGQTAPWTWGRAVPWIVSASLLSVGASIAAKARIRAIQSFEDALASQGKGAFVLLLRPFRADEGVPVPNPDRGWGVLSPANHYEESDIQLPRLLAQAVWPDRHLRVLGGRPIGPGAVKSPDEVWRDRLVELVTAAEGILMVPLPGKEIPWELSRLRSLKLLNKTALLILPENILNANLLAQTRDFTLKLRSDGFEIPFPTAEYQFVTLGAEGSARTVAPFKTLNYRTLRKSLMESGILLSQPEKPLQSDLTVAQADLPAGESRSQ